MKQFIFMALFFVAAQLSHGQQNIDELQLLQSAYGMDKRSIVEEFVDFSDDQKEAFWKLYDEYEIKRKELGQKRYELLNKYLDEFGQVSAEDATLFMRQAIGLRNKFDNLKDNYYKKISMATDPVVAMQFYQIETYLSNLIRIELLEGIYTSKN